MCKNEYNDLKFPLNEEMMKYAAEQAKALGLELDDRLLHHLGFLAMRDPMIIFSDKIYVDDSANTNHFEVSIIVNSLLNHYIEYTKHKLELC